MAFQNADDMLDDLISDSDDELPAGWEMRVTDEGRVFYVDHNSRVTQWKHPKTQREKMLSKDLPFGWERGTDEDGSLVFIDNINKRATCVDPRIAYAMNDKKKTILKFDANSTAMVVLRGKDLRGKTALITGGNSGMGFETAKSLSLHGCHVILVCRDLKKGQKAAEMIMKEQTLKVDLDVIQCDLASLKSVEQCAEKIIYQGWKIDIVICNAAILGVPYTINEDGIELTLATNHLGHFHLIEQLKEVMINSAPARVIVVSSESHRFPSMYDRFDLQDLPLKEEDYWSIAVYNQSKLFNILFAFELNRRMSPYGVYCNAVHPGNFISSNIAKHSLLLKALHLLARPFSKSVSQGAASIAYCATSEELEGVGGYYFNNCCPCRPSPQAEDEELAKRLWSLSEHLSNRDLSSFSVLQGLKQI